MIKINSKRIAIKYSLVISRIHEMFHRIENISKIQLKFTKILRSNNNNNLSFNSHSK